MGFFGKKKEVDDFPSDQPVDRQHVAGVNGDFEGAPVTMNKTWFQTALPVFACGSGLLSDGYINNVCRALSRLDR